MSYNNKNTSYRSALSNGGRQNKTQSEKKPAKASLTKAKGKYNPPSPSVATHFAKKTTPSALAIISATKAKAKTTSKNPRSPSSTESSTIHKKNDSRGTPPRDQNQDTTISPDKSKDSINPPPQLENKASSHKAAFSPNSYRDSATGLTTSNHETTNETDWDDSSTSISNSITESLTLLKGNKKLNSNILKTKKGDRKDPLSLTDSSDSSVFSKSSREYNSDVSSVDSKELENLIKNLPKTTPKNAPKNKKTNTVTNLTQPHNDNTNNDTPTNDLTSTEPPTNPNGDTDIIMGSPNSTTSTPTTPTPPRPPAQETPKTTTKASTSPSIATASTTSSSIFSNSSSKLERIKIANKLLADSRAYDYLADGKFPPTSAWSYVNTRDKERNPPFTHLEGILDPTVLPDMTTIQDGIAVKFAPAAKQYFTQPWDSPDVTTEMLTSLTKSVSNLGEKWPQEPLRQDARHILIALAQTSPEAFDDLWSYTTGYITSCREAIIWATANRIYGSHWTWSFPHLLPKKPKKSQNKRTVRLTVPKPKPTLQTISNTRGRFLARPEKQATTPEQSLSSTASKAIRPYRTFLTMISPPVTVAGFEAGQLQIVENFNLAMEILTDADRSLVIYVWPPKFNDHKLVQPYSKKHLDESYPKVRRIASKMELLRYTSSVYVSEGARSYLKLYCGHSLPHLDLTDTVKQAFQDHQMNIYTETLQAASSMVCGWLLGADARTFNCEQFTDLLNSLPKFAKLPVACKKRILRLTKEEDIPKETGTQGVIILCNADYRTQSNIALKATFNRSTTKAIADRPDGTNFKYVEYYADKESKTPTNKQFTLTAKARMKQKAFAACLGRVRLEGITNMNYVIALPNPMSTPTKPLPDQPTTGKQLILSLKCQSNYECTLFNQIHEQRDKAILGICHTDQLAEATMVSGHLHTILKEKYGRKINPWFLPSTIAASEGYYFCSTTGQIMHDDDDNEDGLFDGFCTTKSPALTANAIARGETIVEQYDGNLDDVELELENNGEPILKLDMEIMFNNTNVGDGGGYDDAQSVGTMLTSTSKATAIINQIGGALTNTEDELSTVTTSDIPHETTNKTATNASPTTAIPTTTAATAASLQQTGVQNDNQ